MSSPGRPSSASTDVERDKGVGLHRRRRCHCRACRREEPTAANLFVSSETLGVLRTTHPLQVFVAAHWQVAVPYCDRRIDRRLHVHVHVHVSLESRRRSLSGASRQTACGTTFNLLACLPDFLLASRQWCPKESPQLPTVGQSPLHHVYIMVRIPHRRSALRSYETLRQYAICVRMLHRALTRFSCSVASVS
jgi:hypothetical protein